MTNVLIIDDQRISREYMEHIVNGSDKYLLIGSLSNADMATTVCKRHNVDLILMDVCMGTGKDGIDVTASLKEQFPQIKVIVVTSMIEESFIKRARLANADSFWYKDLSPEDLLTVMDKTVAGERVWPKQQAEVKIGDTTSSNLSDTEIKILRLVCEGLEYSEIAQQLNYSKDNVKYHSRNILQKTGYANKTQLAIAVTGKKFIIPKLLGK